MVKVTTQKKSSTNAPKVLKNAPAKVEAMRYYRSDEEEMTEQEKLLISMYSTAYRLYKRSAEMESVIYDLMTAKNINIEVKMFLSRDEQRDEQKISFETSFPNGIRFADQRTVCDGVHDNMSKKDFVNLIRPSIEVAVLKVLKVLRLHASLPNYEIKMVPEGISMVMYDSILQEEREL